MRYAGEYKLAGGNVDAGETLEQAAKRELREEFLKSSETQILDDSVTLRPFSVKQTRPIRSRSNLMYNFIALADGEENAWLNYLDVDSINETLREKRADFLRSLDQPGNKYFELSKEEKEALSPEVFQLSWLPLEEAMEHCLTSVLPGVFVNQWQEKQFERLRRTRRDPLIMTGATLVELEKFPDVRALRRYCDSVDMNTLRENEQWLFPEMDNDAVEQAFEKRLGVGASSGKHTHNPSFPSLKLVAREKAKNISSNL
jgi:ADP-ribose pyrophosphatase YjhB (NUDIX family)